MDTSRNEKYFRYDMRYIIGRWNLNVIIVPVEENKRWSETYMPDDVLNLPKFRSWWGCSDVPSKCR